MKISIVIPNFNGKKLLEKNLPFIINSVPNVEIIIVDDASTDNSISFIKKNYPNIILVENQTNIRFAKSCNRGVKKAQGDIVILLNSDVKPDKNFLKPLISHFQNPKVFSVGCKEIDNNIISGRTEGEFTKGLFVHTKPKDQEKQNTFWTFGGSMAFDRQKFLKLRGFNPIYSPAYWEDIDLCYKAKIKGWICLFEKNSIVYHNHETTNSNVFGQKKIQKIALTNQIIFSFKYKPFYFLLWLPYNLISLTLKTKGQFLISLFSSIYKLIKYSKIT